ncbi:FG-GAP repeat protein [Polyangium spumosum]|uniref:Integrin n=1 Tax=Polyangium spumosum TaxID=889282 RepID=A0A6N7PZX3_9BACT|nr:FG-GAP repeat protein [Polyangium spumosum]MRG94251.1 hypothetical protein [Polyangium spumosum]
MRTISSVLCCGLVPLLWLGAVAGCGADGSERTAALALALEWTAGEKLVPPEGTKEAEFGAAAAIDGDTAIVGAHSDDQVEVNAGSAQVFVRKDGVWIPEQKLVASDAAATDGFGYSVAISGDVAIIGAPNKTGQAEYAGAAYVFVRKDGVWTEQQKLESPKPELVGSFGTSVALVGGVALVGASREDGAGVDSGAAHVFVRDASGQLWGLQKTLVPASGDGSHFGSSVALSAEDAIIGAPREMSDAGISVGAAYVFSRAEGAWPLEQRLAAEDAGEQDRFGASVAIAGDTALVGASGHDDGAEDAGAAYVWSRAETTWAMQQKLLAAEPEKYGSFGMATALAGELALVGTYLSGPDVSGAGTAYLFVRESEGYVVGQRLLASDGADADFFGSAVALSVDMALVGAPGDDNDKGENAGSVYTFGALVAAGTGGAGGLDGAGGGPAGAGANPATIGDEGVQMTGGCACSAAGERDGAEGTFVTVMALGMAFVVGRRRLNAKDRRGPSSDRAARPG